MFKRTILFLLFAASLLPLCSNADESQYRLSMERLRLYKRNYKGINPETLPGYGQMLPIVKKAVFAEPANQDLPKEEFSAPVELLEEDGKSRNASVRFGIPVARGVSRNLKFLRVIDPQGKEIPAQFAATGFWNDGSIKWVLVSFQTKLGANERAVYRVEQKLVRREPIATPLKWSEKNGKWQINTGVLSAEINSKKFALLENIRINGKLVGSFDKKGLELRDEQNALQSCNLIDVKIRVEESGADHLTLRADGFYGEPEAPLGSYTIRFTFYAASPIVKISVRHENSNLFEEFTDLSSLRFCFKPADGIKELRSGDKKITKIFQHNDKLLETDGKFSDTRMADGAELITGKGKVSFALRNAALRYPKSYAVDGNALEIALLPELPSEKFGTELPHYLQYLFCEGKYRSKWGMCFTEDMVFDFSGASDASAIAARDIVAVVDRDYLHRSGAARGVPPTAEKRFEYWNDILIKGFYDHLKFKEEQREYGFFNYGDSYGERIYNWTNNEYDMAHGLFELFLRTGNRDVYRYAQITARHHADVDTINFFPTPLFYGSNCQHSIGHTGARYGVGRPYTTWSFGASYNRGDNGHTWGKGMLDAWVLCGDAAVMDSAEKLGHHLLCQPARPMGLAERGAGWIMVALCGFYDITGEKRYLDRASEWAKQAMSEQRLDFNGAWPHKLPPGHDGNFKDAYGNCLFMVGVLTEGLLQYYLVNPTPEAKRSLVASAGWKNRCFDAGAASWPYTASAEGRPYFRPTVNCNVLVLPGYLAGGRLSGDPEIFKNGCRVIAAGVAGGTDKRGKGFAMDIALVDDIIGEMLEYEKVLNVKFDSFDLENSYRILAQGGGGFFVRFPVDKEFRIRLNGEKADVAFQRVPYGAYPKRDKEFTFDIFDVSGKNKIFSKRGSTDEGATVTTQLTGKKGDEFIVKIHDDLRSIWQGDCDNGFVFSKVLPGYSVGSGSIVSRRFCVPAGVKKFSITAESAGIGKLLNVFIYDGEGRQVAARKGGGKIEVNLAEPVKTSASWGILCLGTRGLRGVKFEMDGIPPYLTVKPAIY